MEENRAVRSATHSYTRRSLDAALKTDDASIKFALLETPKPPSKKSKIADKGASESQTVSKLAPDGSFGTS